ncbi:hypothetical protein BO204_005280, partial [Escherichia coli]|nr:hypothetical protein [Escherichia coli]
RSGDQPAGRFGDHEAACQQRGQKDAPLVAGIAMDMARAMRMTGVIISMSVSHAALRQ